jgi:sterol 3beta-glucosyltransferase
VDPKRPRIVQIDFQNTPAIDGYAEFDTEESADDWRRELAGVLLSRTYIGLRGLIATTGALFLYRHRRREFMINDSAAEDLDGVRMCIPLSQIDRIDEGDCLTFTYFLSIYLPPSPLDSSQGTNETLLNKVQFCTIRAVAEWKQLQHHIDAAKHRQPPDMLSFIVFDFGPLTFANGSSDMGINMIDAATHREVVVRTELGIGNESEVWSAYLLAADFFLSLILIIFVNQLQERVSVAVLQWLVILSYLHTS